MDECARTPLKATTMASNDPFQPPPSTRREDFCETLHGVEVPDPYRWLEKGDAPETRAWLSAQEEYARPFLDIPIRKQIRVRLAELMKIDAMGFPAERRGYYFYSRRLAHEQRTAICRRQGLHGEEEVLVDANALSADRMTGVQWSAFPATVPLFAMDCTRR
jgi:prolyl oligopeptidase